MTRGHEILGISSDEPMRGASDSFVTPATSPADEHQSVAGRRAGPDPRNEALGQAARSVRHPRMERLQGEDQEGVESGPEGKTREPRSRESYLAACKTRVDALAKSSAR